MREGVHIINLSGFKKRRYLIVQQEQKEEIHGILTIEEYLNRRQKIREKENRRSLCVEEISPALVLAGLII